MSKRFPSESKIPYPHPLFKDEDAPLQYLPLAPISPDLGYAVPVLGASNEGSNPPPIEAADSGYSNNVPNPDNYAAPAGPRNFLREHGLG